MDDPDLSLHYPLPLIFAPNEGQIRPIRPMEIRSRGNEFGTPIRIPERDGKLLGGFFVDPIRFIHIQDFRTERKAFRRRL